MAEFSPATASSKHAKHARTSPTGLTPRQASKRPSRNTIRKSFNSDQLEAPQIVSLHHPRNLMLGQGLKNLSLVRFLMTRGYSVTWSTTKLLQFWRDAVRCHFLQHQKERKKSSLALTECPPSLRKSAASLQT